MILVCTLCLTGTGLFAAPSSVLAAAPVITAFESHAELSADGTLTVTETITADLPGGGHGMFREIPFVVKLPSGQVVAIPPTILDVTLDGETVAADDTDRPSGDVLRIYMRDPDRTLDQGAHTFTLTYSMQNMVGYFDDHDELNWNVTGNLWAVTIERAVYSLTLPESAIVNKVAAWIGKPGSREAAGKASQKDDAGQTVVRFASERVLEPGEGMTCAVSWNKGVVAQGAPPETLSASAAWTDAAALALAVLVWGYYTLVWWRYGKDPAKGTTVAQFYPPTAPASFGLSANTPMSPAAVNYLMNAATLEARGLSALFLSLVCRKACTISGSAAEGFSLTAAKQVDSPYPEEQDAMSRIAAKGTVPLGESGADSIAEIMKETTTRLKAECPNLWASNIHWTLLGIGLAVAGIAGCVLSRFGWPGDWNTYLQDNLATSGFMLLSMVFVMGVVLLVARNGRYFLALCIAAAEILLGVLVWDLLSESMVVAEVSPLFAAGLVAALLAPCFFGGIMKAPSVQARKLMDACEGLALYIRTAEVDRFRQLNPPERTPELYTRLLPYAVALNLEQAWGENCAAVMEKALLPDSGSHWELERSLYNMGAAAVVTGTEKGFAAYEASQSSAFSSDSDNGGSGTGGGGGGGGFC